MTVMSQEAQQERQTTPDPTWEHPDPVACRRFLLTGATAGERVLDVGSGDGRLMRELARIGCEVVGLEIDRSQVAATRAAGLDVHEGRAEALPFATGSFDRITCSVVLPYTDEEQAIGEWARVLKPGGYASLTSHGLGYALLFVLGAPDLKQRFYGGRMLANTACYRAFGRRLPGFLGDTLCQTSRRLGRYYARFGFVLEEETVVGRSVAGSPEFLCHRIRLGDGVTPRAG
jgi:SAM-dependent methyltransferase